MMGHSITFVETNRHHTGVYTCTAENSEGNPAKGKINLEVTCNSQSLLRHFPMIFKKIYKSSSFLSSDEPEVEIEQSLVSMGEGYNTELTCTVHGEPKPTVTWFKNGQKLDIAAEGSHSQHNHRYSQTSSGARHVLSIDNVQAHDFANYTCQGDNRFGRDQKTIEMTGETFLPPSSIFDESDS